MRSSEMLGRSTAVREVAASCAHPRLVARGSAGSREGRRARGSRESLGPRAGDCLGPYELCIEIATGGMATVFLARRADQNLHRYVALKCIRPALAESESFVEMFFDEASIASQIQHANVCGVIDFDEYAGIYYLAMEYLRGETLGAVRRRLAERQDAGDPFLEAGLVARIIADAAEGLHAAHELRSASDEPLQVVHRDVSPENILVTYDGTAKVMDFGVASASHQRHKTRTGMVKGKYAYLQPEVIQGEKPDRRADVWGLGVVTWELLTRQQLFAAATEVEAIQAVTNREIPPPSTLRPGLPLALDDIVMRCLSRDPDRRYQTARELGRHLIRFLVEHRLPIGLAEISEFMAALFPGGRACKQQLLDVAEKTWVSSRHASDARDTSEGRDDDPTALAGSPELDAAAIPRTRSAVDRRRLADRLWSGWLVGGLAAAAALMLALLVGLGWRDSSPRADEAQARPAAAKGAGDSDRDYQVEVTRLPGTEPGKMLLELRVVPGNGGDLDPKPAPER